MADPVVIWCSIEMRNSSILRASNQRAVVIWCSIEMRNSCEGAHQYGRLVVIWCSIEMRNSNRADANIRAIVVIWCSIEMRNSQVDHYASAKRVVIWCSIEMRNSSLLPVPSLVALWFDALLKWETVLSEFLKIAQQLWFDALLKWETVEVKTSETRLGCDLMLYWNEKQSFKALNQRQKSCDLMLYWNEKQYHQRRPRDCPVVIWCSIEMRNSNLNISGKLFRLWFDALLKWETVKILP